MPTITEYTKNIILDFPNGKINNELLKNEILSSSIATSIQRIDTTGDICSIWFKDVLSTNDVSTLDILVGVHKGALISNPPNIVKIVEENTATGGNYASATITLIAEPNSVFTKNRNWPFPISALSLKFCPTIEQKDGFLDIAVGENTIIGVITDNVSTLPTVWVSQNYTTGTTVTYTHPVFGERVYTCIQSTVTSENPLNTNYWQHGFELNVSSTVIDNTMVGYYINIDDGVNNNNLERVLHMTSSKIYTEKAPTSTYLNTSPTYIKNSYYIIKNYNLGMVWCHELGQSKIGASYIPKDIAVTVRYTNNTNTQQTLIGVLEFLY